MKIIITEEQLKRIIVENEDYRIDHTAPGKEDCPMYDISDCYGNDLFSVNGVRYYGDQNSDYSDDFSINVIKSAINKPNKAIRIYRAIPDLNKKVNKQIKELSDILYYYSKWNFFPRNNKILNQLYDEYDYTKYEYDEYQTLIISKIRDKIKELTEKKQDNIKINDGDWVTINKDYAKSHGINNLNNNYKIITKLVKASQLYTDANSIHEWGYNI